MGTHAFSAEPEHCFVYREVVGDPLPKLFGFEENWNMPVSRHLRSLGNGMSFRGVDHYVLTYHLSGPAAYRHDVDDKGKARYGALSLQRPGSGGQFSTDGVVEYAHYYFTQGLVCEVARETGLEAGAEPEDFFAMVEPTLARDAEAYLFRAIDADDPPASIEMDGRAYFIIAGLLRLTHKVAKEQPGATSVDRNDLRRVLDMIEARLGDPLRLSDLASAMNTSPFHFSRVFKDALGETPWQYVKRRRAEHAVELIRKTSTLSLSEIAFRTGYSSQSHMTRHIKKQTGRTPGQHRAER